MKLFLFLFTCVCAWGAPEVHIASWVRIHVAIEEYNANGLRITRSGGDGAILDTVRCVVLDGPYSGRSLTLQLSPAQRPKDFKLLAFAEAEIPDYAFKEANPQGIYSTRAGLLNITYKGELSEH